MNTLLALVRREARDSRLALVTAPLVSAAVLVAVQSYFAKPYEVADAAAIASALLIALWTLYFSADAFASDFASGRMATKALLPVRAWELWSAKLAFVALAVLALSAWTLGLAYALQWACCGDVAQFESGLARLAQFGLPLALLASAALLCSLLVENSLAAALLASILVGALWGISIQVSDGLALCGVDWFPAHRAPSICVAALILLAAGAFGFLRGQRRLGARWTRVVVTLTTLASTLMSGGVAGAATLYRRVASPEAQLAASGVRLHYASASPDGRFLALAAGWEPNSGWRPPTIFILAVDGGSIDRVTRRGMLLWDRYGSFALPWDDANTLRVKSFDGVGALSEPALIRASFADQGWEFESRPWPRTVDTRLIPAWAEVEYDAAESRSTLVRWKERGIEVRLRASGRDSIRLGYELLAAPEPGRVVYAKEGRLLLLDMASGDERCLLEAGASCLQPSPDGAAVIVDTQGATHLLGASDGEPLHAPWPRTKETHGTRISWSRGVQWIPGGLHHRAVVVSGADHARNVLDLESGATFRLLDAARFQVYRLGDRGYVYERRDRDLVWVDLDGKLVKVLVDR